MLEILWAELQESKEQCVQSSSEQRISSQVTLSLEGDDPSLGVLSVAVIDTAYLDENRT